MKKSKDFDYEKKFEECENNQAGHLLSGIVYPFSFGITARAYCSFCGNVLETYDGIHYLWLHRLTEEIFSHFEMRF